MHLPCRPTHNLLFLGPRRRLYKYFNLTFRRAQLKSGDVIRNKKGKMRFSFLILGTPIVVLYPNPCVPFYSPCPIFIVFLMVPTCNNPFPVPVLRVLYSAVPDQSAMLLNPSQTHYCLGIPKDRSTSSDFSFEIFLTFRVARHCTPHNIHHRSRTFHPLLYRLAFHRLKVLETSSC